MILALDIATNMGVALGKPGATPIAWSVNLGKAPDERRFSKVLTVTSSLIAEHKPDLIALEAPVGGPKTSHYLVGLVACVRGVAFNRGVRVMSCPIGAVRKHFTGRNWTARDFPGMNKGAQKAAIKAQVMARCKLLGWDVRDTDAADAAATWDYACAMTGTQVAPAGELFMNGDAT